jgi:hypothetical protein
MKSDEKTFIAEVYSHIVAIEELIKKYEFEDRIMSVMMIGLLDLDMLAEKEDDMMQLKSIFSYNLQNKDELEVIKEIMSSQFDEEDPLDNLLGDLGISLN